MKSEKAGKNISQVEVLNISQFGFWLSIANQEYFLPFDKFSWFKEVKISEILNVKLCRHQHLYWPDLDIDIELESIKHPEKYPLIYTSKL